MEVIRMKCHPVWLCEKMPFANNKKNDWVHTLLCSSIGTHLGSQVPLPLHSFPVHLSILGRGRQRSFGLSLFVQVFLIFANIVPRRYYICTRQYRIWSCHFPYFPKLGPYALSVSNTRMTISVCKSCLLLQTWVKIILVYPLTWRELDMHRRFSAIFIRGTTCVTCSPPHPTPSRGRLSICRRCLDLGASLQQNSCLTPYLYSSQTACKAGAGSEGGSGLQSTPISFWIKISFSWEILDGFGIPYLP